MAGGSRDFFTYSAEFLPLGSLATTTVNVPIQADSDFQLAELTGDVRDLVASETVIATPAILVTLQDQGTGRVLMDRAQLWTNIVGTAQRPFILPMPKEIRANSVMAVTVQNLIAAVKQIRVSFIGYKIFP